jgi:hypothetical protein
LREFFRSIFFTQRSPPARRAKLQSGQSFLFVQSCLDAWNAKTKNGAVASAVLGAPVDRGHFDWRWRERPALALLVARSTNEATPHPSEVKAHRDQLRHVTARLPIQKEIAVAAFLLRWLQFQRIDPIVHVRRRINLMRFPEHVVLFWSGRQATPSRAPLSRISLAEIAAFQIV